MLLLLLGHVNIDEIPEGDVLVHAGDLTNTGGLKEIKEFCTWMGTYVLHGGRSTGGVAPQVGSQIFFILTCAQY